LIQYTQLLTLGALAGFTIFLGLVFALFQNVSERKKGFLNSFAIGILIFLIIDVFSNAWQMAEGSAVSALAGKTAVGIAVLNLSAVFGGIAIGLLGLVTYETKYMMREKPSYGHTTEPHLPANKTISSEKDSLNAKPQDSALQEKEAYRLSMMIAMSIGLHNFSEGLAIGQSYATGSIGLAVLLIVGFGTHNATEGFGIIGPLTKLKHKPSAKFLLLAGLMGGGPTFIGTIMGSLWTSAFTYILFLSVAGGALIYVSLLMYNSGRKQTTNDVLMAGIFIGLCAGFLTDLILTMGGA
jgi:ZIP family zinc transporter